MYALYAATRLWHLPLIGNICYRFIRWMWSGLLWYTTTTSTRVSEPNSADNYRQSSSTCSNYRQCYCEQHSFRIRLYKDIVYFLRHSTSPTQPTIPHVIIVCNDTVLQHPCSRCCRMKQAVTVFLLSVRSANFHLVRPFRGG